MAKGHPAGGFSLRKKGPPTNFHTAKMIWLLKTEPSVYSYADLERDGQTVWDGVNNNLALKHLRETCEGDLALIYHTGDEKAWTGIAQITRGHYADPKLDDPKRAVCDVKAHEKLENPVTLAQIKAVPELCEWALVKNSRLSVVPVSEAQFQILCELRNKNDARAQDAEKAR